MKTHSYINCQIELNVTIYIRIFLGKIVYNIIYSENIVITHINI